MKLRWNLTRVLNFNEVCHFVNCRENSLDEIPPEKARLAATAKEEEHSFSFQN